MRAVNLLPPDTRGASKASAELGAGPEATGGAGAFVVLGVLAACVAGVAGHVLIDNTIKQRQADLAEVTSAPQALQSQANQLKPYADFDSMAKARVQTVKDLAGSRFDWEQALRDLSRAIPADVTLKSLTGDISTGAGGGGSPLRTAISAPAITIAGCAPGQREVARLMARLHDIDGVTRVSLSKSSAEMIDDQRRRSGHRGRAAQRHAVRHGQAPQLRDGHVLREGRRRGRHDADDRHRHRRARRRPRRRPPTARRPGPRAPTTTTTTTTAAQGGATP